MAGLGVFAGVAASLLLGGIIRNHLFSVTVFDPTTLISVIVVLMASESIRSSHFGKANRFYARSTSVLRTFYVRNTGGDANAGLAGADGRDAHPGALRRQGLAIRKEVRRHPADGLQARP